MSNTSEIDVGGNNGVGVDDTEGILPACRELNVVHGITCRGIYKSEGCEFVYTVMSQALSYLPCRLGLVTSCGSECKGISGQRLQLVHCASLLLWSRYFELYAGICTPQGP